MIDWIVVAVPVATSNFLWMFCAFLGIARPWNYTTPLRDILEIAAALYLVVQFGVFTILAMAGRNVQPDHRGWADRLARSLAAVGSLGRTEPIDDGGKLVVAAAQRPGGGGQRLAPRRRFAAAGRRAGPGGDASGASPGGQPGAVAAPALGALGLAVARGPRRAAARRPSSRTGDRSPPPAPSVRPVCTGEVWMTALRGATSQWKRSRADSLASEPAPALPAQTASIAAEGGADRVDVGAGIERQDAGRVELDPRLERIGGVAGDDHADVDELAALDARHHPDDGVVIGVHRGHGRPP